MFPLPSQNERARDYQARVPARISAVRLRRIFLGSCCRGWRRSWCSKRRTSWELAEGRRVAIGENVGCSSSQRRAHPTVERRPGIGNPPRCMSRTNVVGTPSSLANAGALNSFCSEVFTDAEKGVASVPKCIDRFCGAAGNFGRRRQPFLR